MLIYIMQIIASIIVYHYLKINTLRYLAAVTSVYFFSYLMAGSYDIALPIYYIAVFGGIRSVSSVRLFDLLYVAYIVLYTVVGVFFQELVLTVATVTTRYGYILLLLWYLSSEDHGYEASAEDYRFVVRLGIMTELFLIAIIWLRDGWGVRIITNNQPIGGGIMIALTSIIGYCYLNKKFSAAETVSYCILSLLIIILSGTRGYMVIWALPMAVVAIMYFLDIPGDGSRAPFRIAGALFFVAFAVVAIAVLNKAGSLSDLLRIQEGLGYRENENVFVQEIISDAPWYHKLFGFGFGGKANGVKGFYEALKTASWNRSIMFYKLQSSTIFHNYWYTVLFKQGFLGLCGVFVFYAAIFKRVVCMNTCIWIRLLVFMVLAGTVISLTFRITATCSAYELLLVGYFIRLFDKEQKSGRKE